MTGPPVAAFVRTKTDLNVFRWFVVLPLLVCTKHALNVFRRQSTALSGSPPTMSDAVPERRTWNLPLSIITDRAVTISSIPHGAGASGSTTSN